MSAPTPDNPDCPIYQFAFDTYKLNAIDEVEMEEFLEDYTRFWYIIKILVIYRNSGEINVRLLFNHLIIVANNFGLDANQILMKILLDKGDYEIIQLGMTLLHYIGFIPDDKMLSILSDEYLLDVPISEEFIAVLERGLDEAKNI